MPMNSGAKVPFLELGGQYRAIRSEVEAAMARVVASQRFVLGPEVEACERALADYVGSAHAVGVSSGTDALIVALTAEGIGPGDEVVTTPFTFFATAGAIARVGATPVFADIDPATLNLDPATLAERVTERTRAVVPVHLFGQMAELPPILEIAREHGLVVIEDAAQAIGAEREGVRAGTAGRHGCFSFFPTKNLGGYGDGGLVVTDDASRASTLRALRVHGQSSRYHHRFVGGNFRLDALQAAVIAAKLPHLERWTDARIANAKRYHRLLGDFAARSGGRLALPATVAEGHASNQAAGRHVFNQFVVRLADPESEPHRSPGDRGERPNLRDRVRKRLARAGIGTAIYYPVPLHLQPCFAHLGYRAGDLPASERAADEALALPIFPELAPDQIERVAQSLREALVEG